tara:strand:+ start:279 stop:440 length:162 start_codon:yes stop_codon:yes gene_type:complete
MLINKKGDIRIPPAGIELSKTYSPQKSESAIKQHCYQPRFIGKFFVLMEKGGK